MKTNFFLSRLIPLFLISFQIKAIVVNNSTTQEVIFFEHVVPAHSSTTIEDSTLPEFKFERGIEGSLVMKLSDKAISSRVQLVRSWDEIEYKEKYDKLNTTQLFSEDNPEGHLNVVIKPFKKIKNFQNFSKYKKITIEANKENNSFELTMETTLKAGITGKILYLNDHYINDVNILPF